MRKISCLMFVIACGVSTTPALASEGAGSIKELWGASGTNFGLINDQPTPNTEYYFPEGLISVKKSRATKKPPWVYIVSLTIFQRLS